MTEHGFVDIIGVRVLGGYLLELTWADGAVTTVDVEPYLHGPAFEPLKDPAVFAAVSVDSEAGTVVWPNGADLSPVELRRAGFVTVEQRLWRGPVRSLLLHHVVAGKVVVDPDGIRALARDNLTRLRAQQPPAAAAPLDEWERLLDGPLLELLEVLTSRSEHAQRLRQYSPFAGALTDTEREAALAAARVERSAGNGPQPVPHATLPVAGPAMRVRVDLPLDVQSTSERGWPWAFVDEALDPAVVVPGAHLVAGDDSEPVLVRVVEVDADGRAHVDVLGRLVPADLNFVDDDNRVLARVPPVGAPAVGTVVLTGTRFAWGRARVDHVADGWLHLDLLDGKEVR